MIKRIIIKHSIFLRYLVCSFLIMTFLDSNISPVGNELLKIGISVIAGCLLGLEREIRGKSAGFRTIALICLGATVFTICSYLLGVTDNRDRIAANVITGVGFIGAGVIFRTNSSISGITTAASVWMAAALGMLIGINQFVLATACLLMGLFILYTLDFLQVWIDNRHEHRTYHITFTQSDEYDKVLSKITELKLKLMSRKVSRNNSQLVMDLVITGHQKNLELFNSWLLGQLNVVSFEW